MTKATTNTSSPLLGRSKEAGHKIVPLMKEIPASMRAGSRNATYFGYLLKSKTTDEAAEKIREFTDKPWDFVRLGVMRGLIEIGEPVAGRAAPKAKPAPKGKAPAKTAKKSTVKAKTATKPAPKAKPAKGDWPFKTTGKDLAVTAKPVGTKAKAAAKKPSAVKTTKGAAEEVL